MRKVNLMIMTGLLAVVMAGCSPVDEAKSMLEGASASPDSQTEDASDAASAEQNVQAEAADSAALDALVEGKNTISFKNFADNPQDSSDDYALDVIGSIPTDKEYTLSELKDELNKNYDNGVESMEYAYIDCGADGVKEMALRIQGPFIEPGSKVTLIIKEIDSKLQVVYAYAEWARSETNINEFGFISGGGSGGATLHVSDAACIDADGKYKFGYYEEEQIGIEQFADFREHDDFSGVEYEGLICVYTLGLERSEEAAGAEEYYSYLVCDSETNEPVDIPNLYTDSPHKTVMDSFKDIKFVTIDELKKKKEEKLTSIGVTEQIKNGNIPEYKEITTN